MLRVYIKIKDGPISGRVVGVYHGIKFSFTNRWAKNRGDLLAGEGDLNETGILWYVITSTYIDSLK